jgi:hypothetical protein
MDSFNRFNFDNDENWKNYLRTIELPSGNTPDAMLRVKARWFKKNIDPDFDTSLVPQASKTSQGECLLPGGSLRLPRAADRVNPAPWRNPGDADEARTRRQDLSLNPLLWSSIYPCPGARPFGGSSSTTADAGARNGASYGADAGSGGSYSTRAAPPPPPPPPPRYGSASSGTYGGASAQRRLFFMHLGMVLSGIYFITPLLPYSRTAYVYLMRLSIATLGYRIYLQHGLPSFRPFSMLTVRPRRRPSTDARTSSTRLTGAGGRWGPG